MATVYQPLAAPESGWARYNDNHANIFYSTTFSYGSVYTGAEGGDYHYTSSPTAEVKFSFIGTKVRVIGRRYPAASYNYSATTEVLVDGVVKAEYSHQGADQYKTLFADIGGLPNTVHNVLIRVKSGGTGGINLDAIDIDSSGSLVTQVPATTGVLRTDLASMNVGDYIACKYKAASGVMGKFSDFGGTPTTALHPDGAATPDGFFYFLKVANGLLIADRVVQTNIAWRTMLNADVIEGVSMSSLSSDATDIVPVMTGETTSGVTVTASHQIDGRYAAWKLFNNANGSDQLRWVTPTAVVPYWIKIDLGVAKAVKGYSLFNSMQPTASPKDWTFEGSNTGLFAGEQTVLHTGTAAAGNLDKITYFDFPNTVAYRYYRLYATSNWGYTGYNSIEEMELFDKRVVGKIRSLTGGVSHITADGRSSLTKDAQDPGAFPANNEWDTYIVRSNLNGKISAGSMSVWNWATSTFCRDTPAIGLVHPNPALASTATNINRVLRGYKSADSNWLKTLYYSADTGVDTYYGFRPVLEYR